MLFDPRPKERREDLFDREKEIEELKESISRQPMTLLLGIRRIGKTSVLKVALNELNAPYLYLDLRSLEDYSRASLYRLLSEAFSGILPKWKRLKEFLKNVKGVSVYGFSVEFDWKEKSLSLSEILGTLNRFAVETEKGFMAVAFDEAQIFRSFSGGKGRIDFGRILVYAYDNLSNLRLILTGSEAGLLFDALKLEDPSSPLYGRYVKIIRLERFDGEKSIDFLRKGFEELKIDVDEEMLHEVCKRVDGIAGWLTYFGCSFYESRKTGKEVLDEVTERALKLVKEELEKVFGKSRYYQLVLKAVSIGMDSWSGIKKAVEAWLGKPLHNAQISRIIENLIDLGLLEKAGDRYLIPDPLVSECCRRI
jgi:AAA+ ATPase superfamily predicted ATPase